MYTCTMDFLTPFGGLYGSCVLHVHHPGWGRGVFSLGSPARGKIFAIRRFFHFFCGDVIDFPSTVFAAKSDHRRGQKRPVFAKRVLDVLF